MKVRYFKHATEGYYFGAFVRFEDPNDILAMMTKKCGSMVEAVVALGKALEGWPPVLLVEPMGFTERNLCFTEIKIPVQASKEPVYEVPVKVL